MPTSAQIIDSLAAIANRAMAVAIAWHVVVAIAATFLCRGWRPTERVARTAVTVPLFSVALTAFVFGNVFRVKPAGSYCATSGRLRSSTRC